MTSMRSPLRFATAIGNKTEKRGTEKKGTFYFLAQSHFVFLDNLNLPRTRRASYGGYCYHVLNRDNARQGGKVECPLFSLFVPPPNLAACGSDRVYAFPCHTVLSYRRSDGASLPDYEKRVFCPATHKRGKRIISKALDPLVRISAISFHFIAHPRREMKSECVKRNEMKHELTRLREFLPQTG